MTVRGINWAAVLGGTLVGSAILSCCVAFAGGTSPLTYARLGLVALAAAAAFVLDEPASAAVDAVPTALRRRTALRLTAVMVPLSAWGVGVVALDLRIAATPAAHLLIEGAGVLAATVAGAAALRAAGCYEPGEIVATAVGAGIVAFVTFNPPPRSVPPFPVGEGWAASTVLWCSVAGVSVLLILAASRDPGLPGRRLHARIGPPSRHR